MQLVVTGAVVHWRGPASHHVVRLDDEDAAALQAVASAVTYGWGMVPVRLRVGGTTWTTSLWPKDGGYVVPLKAAVRTREGIELGDTVTVHLEVVGL